LLYLGLINSHSNNFFVVPENMFIFIEISNTLGDSLHKQVAEILQHVSTKELRGNILERIDFSNQDMNLKIAMHYLHGLDSNDG